MATCPKGMWVTEPHAIQKLGLSAGELNEQVTSGKLSHVVVEQGSSVKSATPPYSEHRFFYITTPGESAVGNMTIRLLHWIQISQSLAENGNDFSEMDPRHVALLAKYTGRAIDPDSFGSLVDELKEMGAVVMPDDLAKIGPAKKEGGASLDAMLGAGGGNNRLAGDSHTVTGASSSQPAEGEIYIRADGKKVRRVKKKPAAAGSSQSVAPNPSLSSHLGGVGAKGPGGDSATVPGDMGKSAPVEEGEIYIRADGKKVRRVKKKKAPDDSSQSVAPAPASSSLSTHLGESSGPKASYGDSATVPGDMGKSAPVEEGEIYIRPDGKKVRRVKKKPAGDSQSVSGSASVGGGEEGEIYIRPDGKKVRRVKKKPEGSLDAMLSSNAAQTKIGSGSATVSGGEMGGLHEEGEIYIRPDGKKVRRIKKTRSVGKDLGGFLGSNQSGPASGGSASVAGDGRDLGEIYIRADGKKVRRVKKNPNAQPNASSGQSLTGFLGASGAKPGMSGSATVAGDMVSGSKANYAEGEIYIRPDGKKVRRIRKTASYKTDEEKKKEEEEKKKEEEEKRREDEEEEERKKQEEEEAARQAEKESAVENGDAATSADQEGAALEQAPTESAEVAPNDRATPGADDAGAAAEESTLDISPEAASKEPSTTAQEENRAEAHAASSVDPPLKDDAEYAKYFKMLTMGMPIQAAQSAMERDGLDPAIMELDPEKSLKSQVGGGGAPEQVPPSAGHSGGPSLKDDPEYAKYFKMLTMGMPIQAAQSAMERDGLDPSIMNLDPEKSLKSQIGGAAPEQAPSPVATGETKDAYIVVVPEEDKAKAQGTISAAPDSTDPDPTMGSDGEQRFAVKVAPGESAEPRELQVETDVRYLTLDELSNLSGQSKDDLNAVVLQKMNLDKATPRFILSPADANGQASAPAAAAPAQPAAAHAPAPPPAGAKGKFVPEGMETVDADVAEAARAVKAMGATDIKALMEKLQSGDVGEILKKLQDAEKRQAKLEKQLQQAGVAVADDIPYDEAKEKVEEIAKRMNEIGGSDVTHPDKAEQTRLREEYFKLEQEMERYNSALMLTEEYQAEQDRIERKWEDDNLGPNVEALRQLRRHMPVNIRNLSEDALTSNPSPNGKFVPKSMAKKFKRTNVLMLIRINPEDIERMHPSTLENMRVTGLTLTERRALYAHLQPLGPKWKKNKAEKMTERKWVWYQMMKNNFKESLAPYQRHIEQYGPPENHPYATRDDPDAGCPLLGKQCPVKANKDPDYSGDYGWTPEAEYEKSNVTKSDVDDPGAKAMQEALELARGKKANERADALKKHYKSVLFVSKANGSCESMDEVMDKIEINLAKWLENIITNEKPSDDDKKKEVANFTDSLNEMKLQMLDFATRAGMQMSGKKKTGGDGPDTRSPVECGLSEEVYESSEIFFKFINDRMDELKVKDTRVSKTIELLEGMLGDLHKKNIDTLKKLGVQRPERSRKLKKAEEIKEQVQKKFALVVEEPVEDFGQTEVAPIPPPPRAGRGGLLGAIEGRGRGRGGGRGGLMAAIQGKGGGDGGDGGGRGGLMAAIQGGGRGGEGGGGRGGLMAAIQGKGRGGGGGRGGLMAAIAARGGGG